MPQPRPTSNASDAPFDDELLRSVASGDKTAFSTLYKRYADLLFHFCLRMIGNRDGAKDALQTAMIRLYERADSYEKGTNPKAWIYRLTRNVCIDQLRQRRDHEEIDESKRIYSSENEADVALRDALEEEIGRLSPIYREAVTLRDVMGHSYREISEIVDAPVSAVKFRIFKGRDLLRERLKNLLD